MKTSEARAVLDRLNVAFDAHDAGAILACYSDNALLVDADGAVITREGLAKKLRWTFRTFPDVTTKVRRIVEEGAWIVTEETIAGTHAARGPIAWDVVHVTKVEGGAVVERRAYFDLGALERRLRSDDGER